MAKIEVDAGRCKECRLCIGVCPQGILETGKELNSKGYRFIVQTDAEKCTACRLCAIICPDAAISVYK